MMVREDCEFAGNNADGQFLEVPTPELEAGAFNFEGAYHSGNAVNIPYFDLPRLRMSQLSGLRHATQRFSPMPSLNLDPPADAFFSSFRQEDAGRQEQMIRVETLNAYLYHDKTYKKRFFDTPDVEARVTLLAQYIVENRPDVILLQEIWQKYWWTKLLQEIKKLDSSFPLDAKHAFHFSDAGNGNTDIAVISRFEFSKLRFVPFTEQGFQRDECGKLLTDEVFVLGMGMVDVKIGGEDLLLVNTHTMHRRPAEKDVRKDWAEYTALRSAQILEAYSILEAYQGRQRIVWGGDFNTSPYPGQFEYSVLHRTFRDYTFSYDRLAEQAAEEGLCTYCSDNPLNKAKKNPDEAEGEGVVDHVLVRGLKIFNARIKNTNPVVFSDHYGVEAMLSLDPQWKKNPNPPQSGPIPTPGKIIRRIIEGVEQNAIHPYCYIAKYPARTKRRESLALLENLAKRTMPEGDEKPVLKKPPPWWAMVPGPLWIWRFALGGLRHPSFAVSQP